MAPHVANDQGECPASGADEGGDGPDGDPGRDEQDRDREASSHVRRTRARLTALAHTRAETDIEPAR